MADRGWTACATRRPLNALRSTGWAIASGGRPGGSDRATLLCSSNDRVLCRSLSISLDMADCLGFGAYRSWFRSSASLPASCSSRADGYRASCAPPCRWRSRLQSRSLRVSEGIQGRARRGLHCVVARCLRDDTHLVESTLWYAAVLERVQTIGPCTASNRQGTPSCRPIFVRHRRHGRTDPADGIVNQAPRPWNLG
jgi:hypothetical protein